MHYDDMDQTAARFRLLLMHVNNRICDLYLHTISRQSSPLRNSAALLTSRQTRILDATPSSEQNARLHSPFAASAARCPSIAIS